MSIVNSVITTDLKDIFPELSEKQLEVTLIYSSGMSISDIAFSQSVSETTIKKLLRVAMTCFSVFSLSSLRAVVQTRISMFLVHKLSMLSMQVMQPQPHINLHN